MSPRRYAGWEPVTRYMYDEQGRIISTTPEPEWDEWDTVLVDCLLNWQSGVHRCGHHEDEQADPDVVFVAEFTVCKACEALQRRQEAQAQVDKPAIKAGKNPDYPRWWRLRARSKAQAASEAARSLERKSPQQLMDEAVARLAEG